MVGPDAAGGETSITGAVHPAPRRSRARQRNDADFLQIVPRLVRYSAIKPMFLVFGSARTRIHRRSPETGRDDIAHVSPPASRRHTLARKCGPAHCHPGNIVQTVNLCCRNKHRTAVFSRGKHPHSSAQMPFANAISRWPGPCYLPFVHALSCMARNKHPIGKLRSITLRPRRQTIRPPFKKSFPAAKEAAPDRWNIVVRSDAVPPIASPLRLWRRRGPETADSLDVIRDHVGKEGRSLKKGLSSGVARQLLRATTITAAISCAPTSSRRPDLPNPVFRPKERQGVPHDVYVHYAGIDIVRVNPKTFFVLEDMRAHPSG